MQRPVLRPVIERPNQQHIYGGELTKMEIDELDIICQFVTDELVRTGNHTMTMMGTFCMVHGVLSGSGDLTITVARITHAGTASTPFSDDMPEDRQSQG